MQREMTPEQVKAIEDFDARYPVGSWAYYWSSLPYGPRYFTRITRGAWRMPSGEIVCKVECTPGCVSIKHVMDTFEELA